jgi:hypothetical protein
LSDGSRTAAEEPVFRLIYVSHSLIAPERRRTGLGDIFTTARRKNRDLGVTGALIVAGDAFAQVLEGEEPVVRELYATITEDDRHDGLAVLEEQHVAGRTFGRWAMAKVAEDGGADIRLLSNAQKGVIVAARATDPTVTPAQEEVLAFMRRSIALETLGT